MLVCRTERMSSRDFNVVSRVSRLVVPIVKRWIVGGGLAYTIWKGESPVVECTDVL